MTFLVSVRWVVLLYVLFLSNGCHVVVGVIWAVVKWWLYLKDILRRFLHFKVLWLKNNGVKGDEIPDDKRKDWKSAIPYEFGDLPPKARQHSERIVAWMMWWPWSFFWTLLDDFIVRVYKELFDLFRKMFQRISDSVFSSVAKDFKMPNCEEK